MRQVEIRPVQQRHLSRLGQLFLFVAITSPFLQSAVASEPTIVCDHFDIVADVNSSTASFAVDTDLPDNAVVMVSVSRTYQERENPGVEYSVDYFSEKSTIGDWRAKHMVPIADQAALRAKQQKMARLGISFDVASISDKIQVRMVVPVNQSDPRFGDGNKNLRGMAVRTTGIRVVEDEIKIDQPLKLRIDGTSPFPNKNF